MHASVSELLARLAAASTAGTDAEPYALTFSHGTMSLGFYAPVGHDPQQPHVRDEIYIIHSGTGELVVGDRRQPFAPGDALFVAAGSVHRFENFSAGFSTWVIFWGPPGGESG